ncbi:hypothetical protein [Nonomuraea sp. NPDC049028]|uniref:hypothetical protein n=1 Tax=Nonomuraea sp. NPDC049028 TaxID=3364348 RepID=UPI003718D307
MPLVGDAGGLVNGQFALLSALPGPLVGWTVAMGVVSMLAHAVVLPAAVLMAAGLMLDRSVSPSAALRRAPAMLAAGAIMLLGWAAIVAAGLGVAWATAQSCLSIFVMVGLAVFAAPFLLAVPAVILEGRSGWRALGRGYGRLVLTAWNADPQVRGRLGNAVRLGLLICDGNGCVPPAGGKPLSEPTFDPQGSSVALAVRPDGGLVVVETRRNERPADRPPSEPGSETVLFTFCDDPACYRPERKMAAELESPFDDSGYRSLAVAVARTTVRWPRGSTPGTAPCP